MNYSNNIFLKCLIDLNLTSYYNGRTTLIYAIKIHKVIYMYSIWSLILAPMKLMYDILKRKNFTRSSIALEFLKLKNDIFNHFKH